MGRKGLFWHQTPHFRSRFQPLALPHGHETLGVLAQNGLAKVQRQEHSQRGGGLIPGSPFPPLWKQLMMPYFTGGGGQGQH